MAKVTITIARLDTSTGEFDGAESFEGTLPAGKTLMDVWASLPESKYPVMCGDRTFATRREAIDWMLSQQYAS